MPRVIISSGHTDQNPGSTANGLREYDLSRQIAKAVLPHIRHSGVISLAVPPNLDLFKRLEWINKTGYKEETNDVIIEIHINDGGKSGIEGWYEGQEENNSKKLITNILEATAQETNLTNQGAHSEFTHELGSISFLHETHPIATIIECGYIDNTEDVKFLKDINNINKLGVGIAKGILKYLNVPFKQSNQITKPITSQPIPKPTITANTTTPVSTTVAPMVAAKSPIMPAATKPVQSITKPKPKAKPTVLSRTERKEMIANMYQKILGREPNQNDLNYFLNIGIKEGDLREKMIESQEHADLVKSRQDVIKYKKQYNDQQEEFLRLKTKASDQNTIIQNFQQTIQQKNIALQQMQYRLTQMTYQHNQQQSAKSTTQQTSSGKYKGSFLDKLFKAFSDIFE